MTMRILFSTLVLSIVTQQVAAQTPVRPIEQPRSVTMTLAEYNRLLDLAARAPAAPAAAPVAAVVSSADLKVIVDRESARGVFTLAGQVLQSGISRVPLISGTTLVDANAGGRPVPLVADGQTLTCADRRTRAVCADARMGRPARLQAGRGSFILPVPQAGAARATIDLPGEQADVRLSAGLITRRAVANGRTIVEATLDPGAVDGSLVVDARQRAGRRGQGRRARSPRS